MVRSCCNEMMLKACSIACTMYVVNSSCVVCVTSYRVDETSCKVRTVCVLCLVEGPFLKPLSYVGCVIHDLCFRR